MAVGQGENAAGFSYVSLGRETTYGTYNTATAGIDFLSFSVMSKQEGKILEEVRRSRTYGKRILQGKQVEGDIEAYFYPRLTACAYMLENAFGGAITTATATGETVGGGALTHTILLGDMDITNTALSINSRKGDSTNGKVWEYHGGRINELTLMAELDEPLKISASMVFKDFTLSGNDIESALTVSAYDCLSFVNGRVSVESSFASLTSTSFWHVQSAELTLSNNLKSDNDARRIGSDTLVVLPTGIANIALSLSMRFDTSTAYDALIAETQLSCELEFLGPTMSGSAVRQGLKIQLPRIYINEGGDPEIGGPDEILKTDVSFHVLQDVTSATGYAIRALLTNDMTSI